MKKTQLTPVCRLLADRAPATIERDWSSQAVAAGGDSDAPIDIREEGANMMRLVQAQQDTQTPLAGSSRQARVVLGQF
ncbi:hypothetical protein [Geomonas agri]|uniref:hypothetical protein n=1 Tax=Geomonas agri TaxID=2873702 RepID=UPI001CD73C7E|nr:hypothetical protein [Geomonas agri]